MPQAADIEIMVVDDQRAMRALVRGSLNDLGCLRVVECADGREAFEALKVKPVNLIISDLNMPVMDGMALLRAVRAEPTLASTAFIMLTSRGEADLVKEAIAQSFNNYLVNPFTLAMFKRKIEAVFGPLT
jgi:two-component system, chemotaxis family, chemotaxis protein CheY